MMRVVIFAGMTIIAVIFGAAAARPIETSDGGYILIVSASAILGFLSAEVLLRLIGSQPRRKRRRRPARPRPMHEPQPFRTRLAQYASRDEAEVMVDSEPARSSMPFWSTWRESDATAPKSATLIRRILERIRRLVRG